MIHQNDPLHGALTASLRFKEPFVRGGGLGILLVVLVVRIPDRIRILMRHRTDKILGRLTMCSQNNVDPWAICLAFCQGLAFDLYVSTLMVKK